MKLTEQKEETVQEFQKSQLVRLADIFAFAPLLIFLGTLKVIPSWARALLIILGFLTLVYNLNNYIKNRKS